MLQHVQGASQNLASMQAGLHITGLPGQTHNNEMVTKPLQNDVFATLPSAEAAFF